MDKPLSKAFHGGFREMEGKRKEKQMTKGLGNILKQAQQMHAKISQLQEEMAQKTVEDEFGRGDGQYRHEWETGDPFLAD